MLDGFQISGDSKTKQLESFKQFDTKYIKNVLILDSSFVINSKYNSISDRYNNSILGVIWLEFYLTISKDYYRILRIRLTKSKNILKDFK